MTIQKFITYNSLDINGEVLDKDRSSSLWSAESELLNFYLASEAANLDPPSKVSFHDPVTSSVHEPSKICLAEDPSGWPCRPDLPNFKPLSPMLEDASASLLSELIDASNFPSFHGCYVSQSEHLVPNLLVIHHTNPTLPSSLFNRETVSLTIWFFCAGVFSARSLAFSWLLSSPSIHIS